MSNKFIEYYHQELVYMHEMAREFADNYPKVANRLSMGFSDNSDPYVERLFQGLSFLTAPIHMKMDAEFPQFTHYYLEKLCPEYIAVAPSMGLVQFQINNKKGNLNEGVDIPRGISLRARLPHHEEVLFTTSQAVKLWPLEVTSAKMVSDNLNVIFAKYPVLKNKKIKQAITVQLNLTGSVRLNELSKLENLDVYINGDTDLASLILEAILGHTVSILYQDAEEPSCWSNLLGKEYVEQGGISRDVSLFPLPETMHIGHRLAYEYFLLPEKFRFIQLKGLQKALKIPKKRQEKSGLSSIKITFFLDKRFAELDGALDKNNFLLFCTPIVNLFRQDIKNIFIEQLTPHYPLVADASRPNYMEIFSVTKVEGVSEDKYKTRIDIPHLAIHRQGIKEGYTTQRNAYTFGAERNQDYSQTELTIHQLEALQEKYQISHINVYTLCTNGLLPLELNKERKIDFKLDKYVPVDNIQLLGQMTKPRTPLAELSNAWALISHLNLQYLDFLQQGDEENAADALKDILHIYTYIADPLLSKQISAITNVTMYATHDRSPIPGEIFIARVVAICIEVDELLFAGVSPYLFGCVLEQFIGSFVSQQMAYQVELCSIQRGVINKGSVLQGRRPII